MAAASPRGRDSPSPREFTAVRHFMMADLGLSGLPLLVYARIFGFCDGGCDYDVADVADVAILNWTVG